MLRVIGPGWLTLEFRFAGVGCLLNHLHFTLRHQSEPAIVLQTQLGIFGTCH